MTVAQADPRAQALDEAFAGAMGAAPKPKEPPAPPETDRDAPHGRGEDGEPLAPYGLTRDGRPKLSPAGRKPAATMAVFDTERPRLAAALNLAAQHDARARRLAERLATGDAGWALTALFMDAPFTGTVAAIWQTTEEHDVLAERDLPGLAELAAANEAALDRMFAKITDQMAQAQAAAAAGQGEL